MLETGLYLWGSLDYVPCLTGHSTSANPYYQLWILKLSLLNKSAYYRIHIYSTIISIFVAVLVQDFCLCLVNPWSALFLNIFGSLTFTWSEISSNLSNCQLSTEQENQKTAKDISSLIWKLNPVLIELLIKSKLRSIDSYDIV